MAVAMLGLAPLRSPHSQAFIARAVPMLCSPAQLQPHLRDASLEACSRPLALQGRRHRPSHRQTLPHSAAADVSTPAPAEQPTPAEVEAQSLNFFARVWRAYNRVLHEKPILVKSATSFVGFLVGDVLAQNIVGRPFDIYRTLRLVAFGVFMDGPVGHVWYNTLDALVMPKDPKSNKAVVLKMLCDQVIWAPFFSCVFFTFIYLLQARPDLILPTIKAKLLPMLLANYALWPVAHLINFKFIPIQQRILYINCVQILWSAYLSNLQANS